MQGGEEGGEGAPTCSPDSGQERLTMVRMSNLPCAGPRGA